MLRTSVTEPGAELVVLINGLAFDDHPCCGILAAWGWGAHVTQEWRVGGIWGGSTHMRAAIISDIRLGVVVAGIIVIEITNLEALHRTVEG